MRVNEGFLKDLAVPRVLMSKEGLRELPKPLKQTMRVNIPTNANDLITLSQAIQARHTALGAASPLASIPGMAGFGALITSASTNHQQGITLAEQAQTANQARDNALGQDMTTPNTVRFTVAAARDLLMSINKGSENKLGDWGFDVIASAAKTGAQPAAQAKPAA